MKGYSIDIIKHLKGYITVPLSVMGGAKSLKDMGGVVNKCGLIGTSAGSLFVFKGKYRAVLINYPARQQKEEFIYD